MTANRSDVSRHLTFSERHGYEPLPEPMQLEELSADLRRDICNLIYWICENNSYFFGRKQFFVHSYVRTVKAMWGRFEGLPDSWVDTDNYGIITGKFEDVVLKGEFNHLLDFLEIAIDEQASPNLAEEISGLFRKHAAAYWLDTSSKPYKFFPCSSEAQRHATRDALETIRQAGMKGASAHLRQAVNGISEQRYADSIRESIHAVESIACKIDPRSKSLGPALKRLRKVGLLKHSALELAFQNLYGYTSDEQGIRHALVNKGTADVGLDEAMFMFGACASFAAYLTQKHRQADRI